MFVFLYMISYLIYAVVHIIQPGITWPSLNRPIRFDRIFESSLLQVGDLGFPCILVLAPSSGFDAPQNVANGVSPQCPRGLSKSNITQVVA
ncbi:hypothetical protein BJX64DRAFT_86406 [Aspergillus heterothallicus]